jgi:hypothetical protein
MSGPLMLAGINWPLQILTVLLGHTSPKSSISLPASRPMTCTTDPDSEMESGVAPSAPPASSTLPLPAVLDAHMPLAQPPVTSSSMSLTFVCHDVPIARIDDVLLYDDLYAQTLPYVMFLFIYHGLH